MPISQRRRRNGRSSSLPSSSWIRQLCSTQSLRRWRAPLQGGPTEINSGNWSTLYAVWEISSYFSLKQHMEYFNFRCKIQLDLPVQHRCSKSHVNFQNFGAYAANRAATGPKQKSAKTEESIIIMLGTQDKPFCVPLSGQFISRPQTFLELQLRF